MLEVIPVSHAYKLVSREVKTEDTRRPRRRGAGGRPELVVVAGPCAVETMEQTLTIARAVKAAGAHILRGGAFKPRTSPYSFQGLGEEGLRILAEAREATGLPVVTEAIDDESVDLVEQLRGRHPDRRAQHAELLAAASARAGPGSRSS